MTYISMHLDINGWEFTKPGWHEIILHATNSAEAFQKFKESLDWIYDNIGECERHCRWDLEGSNMRYKFRYERDYIWFKLTWG